MRNRQYTAALVSLVSLVALISLLQVQKSRSFEPLQNSPGPVTQKAPKPRRGQGFTYKLFLEVCAAADGETHFGRIQGPLLGLRKEDYAKWVRGELYVPDTPIAGAGLHSDFDHDGILDRAVPVETENGSESCLIVFGTPEGKWSFYSYGYQSFPRANLRSEDDLRDTVINTIGAKVKVEGHERAEARKAH